MPGTSVGPTQTGSLYAPYWFIVIDKKEAAKTVQELYSEPSTEATTNTESTTTSTSKEDSPSTEDTTTESTDSNEIPKKRNS